MGVMDDIIHIRIDDRFIHGQVASFWTNTLQATRIMVANDDVAVNDVQKQVLRLAAPAGVRTSLISVERAAKQILEGRYAGQRVFVVVNSPADILRLMDLGLPITKINVGNIGGRSDRTEVKATVHLTPEEAAQFHELLDRGVEVTTQMVPSEPVTFMRDLLEQKGL